MWSNENLAQPYLDLMQENQTLRSLLRGVSGFIGEGAGGLLPKLGWDMADFTNFVNRSETDTAWESYQVRKKAAATGSSSAGQKRSADDDSNGPIKKARNEKDGEGFSMLLPLNPPVAPVSVNSLYPSSVRSPNESNGIFSDLMRGAAGSPMFMQPSPASTSTPNQYGAASPGFSSTYSSMPMNQNSDSSAMPPPSAFPSANGSSSSAQRAPEPPQEETPDEDDPKMTEAHKLIRLVQCLAKEITH